MSEQIRVSFGATIARVAALRAELQAGIHEMNAEYNQIQSMLTEVDGATTAAFVSAMENNKLKAKATAATLDKLLVFLNNSTNFVEDEDKTIGNTFNPNNGAGGLR